jgi:ribosomal-protein-serine acetyltransferase
MPNPTRTILPEIIVDEEITLRLQSPDNAEAMHEIIDAERDRLAQLRSVTSAKTVAEHRKRLEELDADRAAGNSVEYAIWFSGALAGEVGFQELEGDNNAGLMHYWLRESCTGKGIMTRAARALTRYGFEHLNLNRIEISMVTSNDASRAIPARLGYQYEGTLRDEIVRLGEHHDLAIYSMLAGEWQGRLR